MHSYFLKKNLLVFSFHKMFVVESLKNRSQQKEKYAHKSQHTHTHTLTFVSQLAFFGKLTLRWRLVCRMFIKEWSWDQYLWKGGEGSRIG